MAGNTAEDSTNRKVTIFRTLSLEHHCVRNSITDAFVTQNEVKMVEVLYFWPLVFEYLEPEDLASVSSPCIAWWGFVFQGTNSTAKRNAILKCSAMLFPRLNVD